MDPPDTAPWLLFGATGMVGSALLARLQASGTTVFACSRQPVRGAAGPLIWLQTGLESAVSATDLCGRPPAVIACAGPLDAFAGWLARHPPEAGTRVLALSSLSADWKLASRQPGERALAVRLRAAEDQLLAICREHAASARVLRCGLIYEALDGSGRDRSLSPLLRVARRLRFLPWPRAARGLRQPVHADDLAAALIAAAAQRGAQQRLDLPGPEAIDWPTMLQRSFESMWPRPRLLPLPLPGLEGLARAAAARDSRIGRAAGTAARLFDDQLAPATDWSTLGLRPRRMGGADASPAPPRR